MRSRCSLCCSHRKLIESYAQDCTCTVHSSFIEFLRSSLFLLHHHLPVKIIKSLFLLVVLITATICFLCFVLFSQKDETKIPDYAAGRLVRLINFRALKVTFISNFSRSVVRRSWKLGERKILDRVTVDLYTL